MMIILKIARECKANSAPTYISPPTPQTLPLNSVIDYTMPAVIDPDGDTITTSLIFPDSESYATYIIPTRTLHIAPTSCADLGGRRVYTVVSDGLLFTLMNFTITVTNSLPVFTAPLQNKVVAMYQTVTYTLPSTSDAEGQGVALWTRQSNSSWSLPNFMSITGWTYTIRPTTADQIGTYTIYANPFDCS